MRLTLLAALSILAFLSLPAHVSAQTPFRFRSSTQIHPGYGVDDVVLGMPRAEVNGRIRFVQAPDAADAQLPFTVAYSGESVQHVTVNLRANPLGVRVSPVHFFRPDASFSEVVSSLGTCTRPEVHQGWHRAFCFAGALTILGTVDPPYEVGLVVTRPADESPVTLRPGQSLGPIQIGMTQAEVQRAVHLVPAPQNLYLSRLGTSQTVPYAVRYDQAGRVSAVYIHQLYLSGSLIVGARSYNRWALSQSLVDSRLAEQWEQSGWTRSDQAGVEISRNNYGMLFGCVRIDTTDTPDSEVASAPLRLEPHEGVGPIRFGMSQEEVAALDLPLQPHPRWSRTTVPFHLTFGSTGRLDEIRISIRFLTRPLVFENVVITRSSPVDVLFSLPSCGRTEHAEGGSRVTCRGFVVERGSGADDPVIVLRRERR